MKKILVAIIVLLSLLLAAIYLFIPARIDFNQSRDIAANREALYRSLSDETNWAAWWPGEQKTGSSGKVYTLNGMQYQLLDKKVLSLPIRLSSSNADIQTELTLIAINPDSVRVQIHGAILSSANPLTRVRAFFAGKKIKKDLGRILLAANDWYKVTKNLYGFDIQNKQVVDSILLMNTREMKGLPTTADIYSLVDELQAYIKQQGAVETGNPMLNIFTKDSINYLLKVAIPVDKKLPPSGNMSYRWMLGGGNILITEVKGDNTAIRKAYEQVRLFIEDFNRIAPAIPFESLVTDRRKEPDSSKWITRIYYPVM